eukprot:12252790-Karenia_brevis.AAC.1
MRDSNTWGDSLSAYAIANATERPLIIWRVATLQQPTCIVPRAFDLDATLRLIYLLLDEIHPGSEHFTALQTEAQ